MARVVLGMGTSHTPMLSLPHEYWPAYAELDKQNQELLSPRQGRIVAYADLLAEADPGFGPTLTAEQFRSQYETCQQAIDTLHETLAQAALDAVVILGDDQEELYFDDNMPAISIYWGESIGLVPYALPDGAPPPLKLAVSGYGTEEAEYRIASGLARHLIDSLIDAEFDIGQSRYLRDSYGGRVGPAGYFDLQRATAPRRFGMPHAFAFVVTRLMADQFVPFVPVTLNTCYPPNQPTARRCYQLGRAIRKAIDGWPESQRVGVIASGGLSHFVVDDELDRLALQGLRTKDAELLASLPRERLQSASSEIKNWICAAGALEHLQMELLAYVPTRRTPAGTGGGWAFARWQ